MKLLNCVAGKRSYLSWIVMYNDSLRNIIDIHLHSDVFGVLTFVNFDDYHNKNLTKKTLLVVTRGQIKMISNIQTDKTADLAVSDCVNKDAN